MTLRRPTLLAIDTSAAHCAAALLSHGEIVAARFEEMPRGQAERLMPLLEALLAEAGVRWSGLDAIAVGVGPGNFTGVRIAVAAARGLALGLGVPAVGISTFEAMLSLAGMPSGRVAACLPAPRQSVLCQLYEDGAALGPPSLLQDATDRWATALRCDTVVIPADWSLERGREAAAPVPRTVAVGLGAELCPVIGQLAAERIARGDPGPRPAPLYVRAADAAPPADPPPLILP